MKKILLLLALLALGFGVWKGWELLRPGGEAAARGWKTVEAGRGEVVQTVTANGSLAAVQTVEVGSEVSGKIVELFADYNSAVTNGQLLARLDDSTYRRQREQAEAELESSRASHKLALANFNRAHISCSGIKARLLEHPVQTDALALDVFQKAIRSL